MTPLSIHASAAQATSPTHRSKESRPAQPRMRATSAAAFSAVTLALAIAAPFASAQALPNYVDLRADQTPIRNQGARTTCITFAAVAALEAAYRRGGYGSLDLSEQFLNHMGKTFWLHPYWPEIVAFGLDGAESQAAFTGGGGAAGYMALLADKLKVPDESTMPYRSTGYTAADDPALVRGWDDPYWLIQRHRSDFNLNPKFLPLPALKSYRYFSASGYHAIDPRSATAIETALAARKEVVWDFVVANTGSASDPIWRPCRPGQAACPSGGHGMLIVGYDRRSADPRQHYFIAKNSWGDSGVPGSNGFTYISYDYLQYGAEAAYVDGVKPPAPWPELAFVGRWNLNFDGWKGSLDNYHLPGMSRVTWAKYGVYDLDLRLGSYHDSAGTAYRVNGAVAGNSITFYIDGANANAKWDQIGGRRFNYSMVKTPWGELMAGTHRDGDGRVYGGYAMKDGFLPAGTPAPRPLRAASYLGANWAASFDTLQGTFRFSAVDTARSTATTTVLSGQFTQGSTVWPATATVPTADPNSVTLKVASGPAAAYTLNGRFLNWEQGVVAGHAVPLTSANTGGFVLVRQ